MHSASGSTSGVLMTINCPIIYTNIQLTNGNRKVYSICTI